MPKRLLLVGAEPMKLKDAPDFESALAPDWEFECASACPQAFDRLHRGAVHAVMADTRLPGATGLQFLDTVMAQHPTVQRFLLADLADKQTAVKCLGAAHPFIAVPCDGKKVAAALARAAMLDLLFSNENAKKLLAQMPRLPSPPGVYFQIIKELQSPTATLESAGKVIARDPAITAKLLQLVNSAAFGLSREVADPTEAVLFLGVETTKSLILLAHTYSHFDRVTAVGFSMDALWRHSLITAKLARSVARAEEATLELEDEAFTAGLVHDIGKLLLAANKPEEFNRAHELAKEKGISLWDAEQEVFGANHAEVGAWLMAIWGLPLTVVEALALHHFPARMVSQQFSALTAVHVANVLDPARQPSSFDRPTLDLGYLTALGLNARCDDWQKLVAGSSSPQP